MENVLDAPSIITTLKAQQNNTIDDLYDEGFYNGLEMALSLLEDRDPVFKWTARRKSVEI